MKFIDNILGRITTAYSMAMYGTLTDICLPNAVFFRVVDTEILHVFSKSDIEEPNKLNYNYFMKT